MYCSSCGIDSVEGLKYCKRCGANLTAPSEPIAVKRFPPLLIGLFLLVIGGIAALGLSAPLLMARDLVNSGFMPKQVLMLFACSSSVTVVVIGLLIKVLMRLIGVSQRSESASVMREHAMRSYEPSQIPSPPRSIGSVTENTTRSFDPRRVENLHS
jgi:hypothetical protein